FAYVFPERAGVPGTFRVTLALGHVVVFVGELGHAGQLAGREVRLDRVKRLLERLLVCDLARPQEPERFLDPRISRDVDQSLVDNLGAGFRGDVRAKIGGWLSDRIDIGRRPRRT